MSVAWLETLVANCLHGHVDTLASSLETLEPKGHFVRERERLTLTPNLRSFLYCLCLSCQLVTKQ